MAGVNSGIDPQAVLALMDRITSLRGNMSTELNTVSGEVANTINQYYQGAAASSLLSKIQSQIPELDGYLASMIKNMNQNINSDLDSTQRTDEQLS